MNRLETAKSRRAFIRYSVILLAVYLAVSCKNTIVAPTQENPTTLNTTTTPNSSVTGSNTTGTSGSHNGVTSGSVTTGTATSPTGIGTTGTTGNTAPALTYKTAAPILLSNVNNMTISGDLITGGSSICISLQNCSNIHITKCKLQNSTQQGIKLYQCTNITIDSCFITNVQAGVTAMQSTTVKVNNNQFLNMNGPFPSGNFIQFDNVNGSGNQMNYNKCEDIAGVAEHPQDGLSVFKSSGLPGDSIQVIGNWIRGGQILHDSGGATGIGLGDNGGSYQVARYNILVNPGYVGIQPQGGNHIKVDHNTIYSTSTAVSLLGMACGNLSGLVSSDIYMGYNKIKWTDYNGHEDDQWFDPQTVIQPQGWNTNILNANISVNVLPTVIITFK